MITVKKIFPSVGDYVEAFSNPVGRFASLEGVCAATDGGGELFYVSGTGRVTFRVFLNGELHALTCFTSATCIPAEHYGRVLPAEIYVFNHNGMGDYYPLAVRPLSLATSESVPTLGSTVGAMMGDGSGELCEGLRVIVREGLFGYADEAGHIAVEPRYAWAGDFAEGRAAVAVASRLSEGLLMGLIDGEGREVVAAEYDDLSWDGSRYAYVDRAGLHGCLYRTGLLVVPLEYDGIGEFDNGFAVVWREGLHGYVDVTGALRGPGLVYAQASSVARDGTAEVFVPGDPHRTVIRLF